MQIWTWHTPDFSLTSDCYDVTKSEFYNLYPAFPAAYAELAKCVGTEKIIWCFVRKTDWPGRVEWVLDVPDDKILALVDSFVWNKIIGHRVCPESLRQKLWNDAPQNIPSRAAWVDQGIKEYHATPEPVDGWWSHLFIKDVNAEGADALVEHPIPESWVLPRPNTGR